jgi:hypothetical protein
LGNQEGRNAPNAAVGLHDGLHETGSFAGSLREQTAGTGISAKVEVKGAVLLEKHENVFDVLAQQIELLCVAEVRRIFDRMRVPSDFVTGLRCNLHKLLLVVVLLVLRHCDHRLQHKSGCGDGGTKDLHPCCGAHDFPVLAWEIRSGMTYLKTTSAGASGIPAPTFVWR